MDVPEIKAEVLVIGSEAAGAKAALEAQLDGADVLIVTKGLMGRTGSTVMAASGVQAAIGHEDPRDNPDVFFEDVVKGGDYLNNQKLVERLVKLSVTEVPKMEAWGAKFNKNGDKFRQSLMPGSTYPRMLAAVSGGLQWRAAFWKEVKRLNTRVMEDVFVTSLLTADGQVAGALGISLRTGQLVVFRAKVTALATGGCCQIYRMTDTSIDATGDGMSMALNAGAELMDMEFQQFFPMACYNPALFMSKVPAGIRYGLHAIYYNSRGEAFMEKYSPEAKDWDMRDLTSRAIYTENMYGRGSPHGGAYLSIAHLPANLIDRVVGRGGAYWAPVKKAGIDLHKEALESGPAAHYSMGGIRVNENCETGVPRLYAVGEVASGPDGAERIDGGPAICWCFTMGYIAGKETARQAKELDWLEIDAQQVAGEQDRVNALWERKDGLRGFEVKDKVKDLMWKYCAPVRNKTGLEEAIGQLETIKNNDLPRLACPGSSRIFSKGWVEALEAINMVELSEIVARAALMREESRKAHYRSDFPKMDNKRWLKNVIIRKDKGKLVFTTALPVMTRMRPAED